VNENRISSIIKLADGNCSTPGNYASKWDFGYDGDGVRVSTLLTTYANGQIQSTELTVYYTSTDSRQDGLPPPCFTTPGIHKADGHKCS
jgi:hypothetical protein